MALEGSQDTSRALDQALEYHKRGWAIIPIKSGTKQPAVSWKPYQDEPPSEAHLIGWFGPDGVYSGMAVILGEVSGRLAVRDFDEREAYDRWAEDSLEYAQTLPTVKTPRGCHVYITLPEDSDVNGTVHLVDGEFRSEGGIVLLPPSIHPSGSEYEWIIPLTDNPPPEVDPHEIGLIKFETKSSARILTVSEMLTEGHRNATLTSLAGSMRRKGATPQSILAALLEENDQRCSPPLDQLEVVNRPGFSGDCFR